MLDGFVPVRVLVPDGREDLVEVERECVPYERPHHLVPLLLLQAILNVRRAEVVVALHCCHAQHQLARDETFAAVLHGKVGVRRRVRVRSPGRHEPERGTNGEFTFTTLLPVVLVCRPFVRWLWSSSSGGWRCVWVVFVP